MRIGPIRIWLLAAGCCGIIGCSAEVTSDLDESRAAEIVIALDEAGIGGRRERQDAAHDPARYRVLVARDDLPAALAVLHDRGLPREPELGWSSLLAETSLVPSASEERARHAAALGGELARSIERMEGVARARVHLALPDPAGRPLDAEAPEGRASVLVSLEASASASAAPDREDAIRTLVAGAVNGLDAEAVAVVTTPAPAPRRAQANLIWIGPVAVSRGSAGAFKAILGGSFLLNLLLALGLLYSRWRATSRAVVSSSGSVTR